MPGRTLLVIDDEESILHFFRRALQNGDVEVLTAASGAGGLDLFVRHRPNVVVLDVNLPDQSGLAVFRQIAQRNRRTPVVFISGRGTTGTAIEAMSLGAYEYLLKPLELDPLYEILERAFEISRLMSVPALLAGPDEPEEGSDPLVGRCAAMQNVYKSIGRVAPQDVTVLILGESGTGKELVARAIYHYSRRATGPFLAINCAAIPEALLESELFGHEKGAFTGADRRRIGKFEQCRGGTLFLDEIGDMAPATQTKILRALQEQCFERVGGNETIRTDVRVIAATNRDLAQLIATNQFRDDLYYRLNVYTIKLPPLRERGEDLSLLVRHFLRRFNRELGKDVQRVAPQALELLKRYPWPGNLRELQSVVKQAMILASGPVLAPEFLLPPIQGAAGEEASATRSALPVTGLEQFVADRIEAGSTGLYAEWTALTERFLIDRVLRHTGGNISRAARLLGIDRSTLRTRISALGLVVERTSRARAPSRARDGD